MASSTGSSGRSSPALPKSASGGGGGGGSESPGKVGGSGRGIASSPKRARPDYRECPHVDHFTADFVTAFRRSLVRSSTDQVQCTACGRPDDGVSLYVCLTCGVAGCLEADRLHLPEHFTDSLGSPESHCVAVSPHTGLLYCWSCQQFVWTTFLDHLHHEQLSSRKLGLEPMPADKLLAFRQDAALQRHCIALRGLHNLGKTCFMNCVLQVLLHNPHLFKYFISAGHDIRSCKRSTDGAQAPGGKVVPAGKAGACIACEIDALFVEMYSGSIVPHPPTRLLHTLWTSFKHLAGYEQQDAHEFLVALLFKLHEHLGGRAFGCECVIHRTFSGVLQSSVTCLGCGTCSPVFDPFMDIALDVMQRSPSEQLSLQVCLERFCAVETLPGGSYVCAACNSTYKEAHKQLSIRRPPNTLCVQLKRFGQGHGTPLINQLTMSPTLGPPSAFAATATTATPSSKLLHHVTFPEQFSIRRFLSDADPGLDESSDHFIYKLAAVINHIGDLDTSGHYISYLNHHGTWFRCDDACISVAPVSEVYQCNAYMLFYNRTIPH